MSDDPRFGLRPLAVEGPTGPLHLPLYAAWVQGHHADHAIRETVRQITHYCADRYGPGVRGDAH